MQDLQLDNIRAYCHFKHRSCKCVCLPYFCDYISHVIWMGNSYNHTIVRKDMESKIRDKKEAGVALHGNACDWGLANLGKGFPIYAQDPHCPRDQEPHSKAAY